MELPDQNVVGVIKQLESRMKFGYSKYGVTTERDDVDLLGWLQHLQEELMDACVYVERLKKEVTGINQVKAELPKIPPRF